MTAASPTRASGPGAGSGSATAGRPAGGRVLAVARLHLVNRMSVFGIPWIILAFIFLVNLVIWWAIFTATSDAADRADAQEGLQYSGATFWIFVYMMVLGIQAVALAFPFALGFSVTRREFWLGTALNFVIVSAVYSAGMTLFAVIEQATGGWGFGAHFFTALYFGGDSAPWYLRFLLFFAIFLFFFFVGAVIATIYQRWRVNGMLVFFGVLILVALGLVAWATLTQNWPAVGAWFVATGVSGVVAWSVLPTVLSAIAGYLIIRRATPKN
ncbi:hypothetical protein [Herbiconiux sp. YIM B11900]|uniref:hypothetical protein n=1 Tax=Herbiconiux sp. YIM B11900 TaxID=3404131 RepID=UPI003F851C4B